MRPPVASIIASELWRTIKNGDCGERHPRTGARCVLSLRHDNPKHKTETESHWVTWADDGGAS